MKNLLEDFIGELYLYLTGKEHKSKTMLIKQHTENLQTFGDFSFENNVKSWRDHFTEDTNKEQQLMDFINKNSNDLTNESLQWTLKVSRLKFEKDRACLFLERPFCVSAGLKTALENHQFIVQNLQQNIDSISCDLTYKNKEDLTFLRLQHVVNVLKNLSAICLKKPPTVIVSDKSGSQMADGVISVLCGPVLNSQTGAKEVNITSDEYIRMRQNDMLLVAQHKYGLRVSQDSKWKSFIDHLGESAVVFEMLQIKPSNPVKIQLDCPSVGSSKGASFVLYNCARMENILKTFSENVEKKIYPELPGFNEVDWSLLSDEDEWILIFNYIMSLPTLLDNCASVTPTGVVFRPHLICGFLSSMVRIISQYYRRVRILTEPRQHLLPVLFARIHMLKILNCTLKLCLNIINIKSVQQM